MLSSSQAALQGLGDRGGRPERAVSAAAGVCGRARANLLSYPSVNLLGRPVSLSLSWREVQRGKTAAINLRPQADPGCVGRDTVGE